MAETETRTREQRARRALQRRGYSLEKSRRRDPTAYDYGAYTITDALADPGTEPWTAVLPTLEDVEGLLSGSTMTDEIPPRLAGTREP